MTNLEVRKAIIKAADASRMLTNLRQEHLREFESGSRDIKIAQLNFESLAVIEFCLILEEHYGYSIPARKFYELTSLGELATDMESRA